jgi:hypothetical protein
MKRITTKAIGAASLGIALAVLTAAAPATKPASGGAKPTSTAAPKLQSVTIAIRHRIFHEFADQQTAVLNKDFVVGDTQMTGRIVQYVPDFMMDLKNGKIISRSPEPKNPAFKIIVRDKGKAVDTTWAMLSLPPHFARKSYLAFKVMRIDFVGREPLLADSAQSAKELEALKEAARKAAPPEMDGPPPLTTNPHGGMPGSPHGDMTMPPASGASPHGTSPHGTSPHGGVTTVPSHQSTTETK